jgi:hypothetical protein
VTARLLGEAAPLAEREALTNQLYEEFSSVVGLDPRPGSPDRIDTALPTGFAMSTALAGSCLKDPIRISVFLRGIEAAIREAQRRFPGQRIEILYAGTGPFAPLAIPVMTRFSADEIRFTLLDIHERSVKDVRALVDYFGVAAYVRDFVIADATAYAFPAEVPLHMVMVETTQRALAKEPYVAMVRNLVPQMQPNGILIPERITVDLVLTDAAAEAERTANARIPLAGLIDLTAATAASPIDAVVTVPDVASIGRYAFAYITRLGVFGPHALSEYDTGVTHAEVIWNLAPVSGQKIVFRYVMGRHPGLQFALQ